MDPDYGAAYEDLYRRHWWWRARERLLERTLSRFAPVTGWESILDVGCGNGLAFDFLRRFGKEVRGIELDAELVSGDGPDRDLIHVGPLDETYEPPFSFSLITMLDVLEHIENPLPVLERARSVACAEASLLVTVPAFRGLWTSHDEMNRHYTRYTRSTLKEIVGSSGVNVLHLEYFFHWLAPAKLAVQAKERLTGPARATVPTVPPGPVNRLLYGVSRCEQMIPSAVKPPFGSSLILMGQFASTK